MKALFAALRNALSQGDPTVLITVIASSGSTPRGAGARMLVAGGGLLAGTIGGGAVEGRCIALARELLEQNTSAPYRLALELTQNAELGMACGGLVEVYFLPFTPGDPAVLALCRDMERRFEEGSPFWLATPLCPGEALTLWPPRPEEASALPPELDWALAQTDKPYFMWEDRWFCEELLAAGIVYIFGGGHVAQALVPVLTGVGFACAVLEDREEFSRPELFPLARSVRKIDFSKVLESVPITADDYVCIMTRGHRDDLLIQAQVLRSPARYLGLIGSAAKSATVQAALREMGFTQEDLKRIVNPIGIPLGGNSPAEIAISITAQLIRFRCTGRL